MWDIFRFNSRQIICLLIEVPKVWSYLDNQQNLDQFAFLKNLRLNTIVLALICNFWECKCTVPILLQGAYRVWQKSENTSECYKCAAGKSNLFSFIHRNKV